MQNVPKGLDATKMGPEMCYISKHWGAKCSNTMISSGTGRFRFYQLYSTLDTSSHYHDCCCLLSQSWTHFTSSYFWQRVASLWSCNSLHERFLPSASISASLWRPPPKDGGDHLGKSLSRSIVDDEILTSI